MSDEAVGFLEGFSKALEPWAAEQQKRKSANNRMVDQAAFTKSKNTVTIEGSANLLADRFSGSEERGESWNALKNSLIKYANNNPNLLTNIRKDISTGGGNYTFGDKGPPGSINIIGKLWRSTGLSQTERTLKRRFSEASDAWHTIRDWRELNPTIKKIPTLKILREKELENMNIQGKATYEQTKLATEKAIRKQSYYNSILTDNSKALLATGQLGRGIMGEVVEGDPRNNVEALLSGMHSSSEGSALNAAMPQAAAEAREESSISNLWGLFGDDKPTSLQDLNLNQGQLSSVNNLLSEINQVKQTGKTLKAADRRIFIDQFLSRGDLITQLPDDRREALRELLEAAFD